MTFRPIPMLCTVLVALAWWWFAAPILNRTCVDSSNFDKDFKSCLSGLNIHPLNAVPRAVPSVPPLLMSCAKFRTPTADQS